MILYGRSTTKGFTRTIENSENAPIEPFNGLDLFRNFIDVRYRDYGTTEAYENFMRRESETFICRDCFFDLSSKRKRKIYKQRRVTSWKKLSAHRAFGKNRDHTHQSLIVTDVQRLKFKSDSLGDKENDFLFCDAVAADFVTQSQGDV
jgi:hypothetical protein